MSKINWEATLGWNDGQSEEFRVAGFAYIKQGKYDIALAFFEALIVLNPDNAYDAQTLGALYLQLNDPIKALKALDHALKLDADHSPTLLNLAKALLMLDKTEDALRLANILQNEKDLYISSTAKALLLAYG